MNQNLKEKIRNAIQRNGYHGFYSQYLKSLKKSTGYQAMALCPFHDDKTPSLSVNLETGLWNCFGCDSKGDEFTFYMKFKNVTFERALYRIAADYGIDTKTIGNGDPFDIQSALGYHDTLMERPEQKKYLNEKRGLTEETIKKFHLGYSESLDRYMIPIFDKDKKLINLKRYLSTAIPKCKNAPGSKASLFNIAEMLESDKDVFVCEGEFDAMLLDQNGFLVVSGTTGAKTFEKEWVEYFKGRTVRIIYDTDKAGKTGAQKVASMLLPVAKEVKIINLPLKQGKDVTDFFLLNGGTKEELERIIKETKPEEKPAEVFLKENPLPLSLPNFLKQDIPPVEYYISALLPKRGRGMISGGTGRCKSIILQNLALAMACGKTDFLGKFKILPAKVLYLDLEMGESALKERFAKMCAKESLAAENLFVKSLPGIDLMNPSDMQMIQGWIKNLKIDVLIIDPLGSAWHGNENAQVEVQPFTILLNQELIAKYGVSFLCSHHWRKPTKDSTTGGNMAAGSYRWEGWLDGHITIEGSSAADLTISSAKQRHSADFSPFRVKLNPDTLCLEFTGDFVQTVFDSELVKLFESFECDKVSVPDLIKRAEDKSDHVCSETTLRKLIRETKSFVVNTSGRPHYLTRKGIDPDLFKDVSS